MVLFWPSARRRRPAPTTDGNRLPPPGCRKHSSSNAATRARQCLLRCSSACRTPCAPGSVWNGGLDRRPRRGQLDQLGDVRAHELRRMRHGSVSGLERFGRRQRPHPQVHRRYGRSRPGMAGAARRTVVGVRRIDSGSPARAPDMSMALVTDAVQRVLVSARRFASGGCLLVRGLGLRRMPRAGASEEAAGWPLTVAVGRRFGVRGNRSRSPRGSSAGRRLCRGPPGWLRACVTFRWPSS